MFGAKKRKAAQEQRRQQEDAERADRYERLRQDALAAMRPEQVRTGPIPRTMTVEQWLEARRKWLEEQQDSA